MRGVERLLATPAVVMMLVIAAMQVTGSTSTAHRCYVCVPRASGTSTDVYRMFAGSSPVQSCEDWTQHDQRFIRDCPVAGCQTQTNGSHVTRTCGDVPLNACNTANKIKYCYCTGDLCNGPTVDGVPSDDEDLTEEGSGGGGGYTRNAGSQRATPPSTVAVAPITTARTTTSDASRHGVATLLVAVGVVCAGWK